MQEKLVYVNTFLWWSLGVLFLKHPLLLCLQCSKNLVIFFVVLEYPKIHVAGKRNFKLIVNKTVYLDYFTSICSHTAKLPVHEHFFTLFKFLCIIIQ